MSYCELPYDFAHIAARDYPTLHLLDSACLMQSY